MVYRTRLATIVICLLLAGCAKPFVADDSKTTPDMVKSVSDANNEFALDLYQRYQLKDGNIFFSPYSISTAMAICYEGARGVTASEMQSVMHYPDIQTLRTGSNGIYNILNKMNQGYILSTANLIWVQKDYPFTADYLQTVNQFYHGKVANLDFIADTEGSRVSINNWIDEQTNYLIKDIIPPGVLNSLTKIVVTNAIYFKGDWKIQFDEKETKEEDFRLSPNRSLKTPIMHVKESFNYGSKDALQIIEIPYTGKELTMIIILPATNDLSAVENKLTTQQLDEWKGLMKEQQMDVYIPRFKFEIKNEMAEVLMAMGMRTAFIGNDFSGMSESGDLHITYIVQQAFIEVNEEGTETAAATGIDMKVNSTALPTVFRADHPFIFLIQEKSTGAILFMGRVMDPTAK